MGCAQNSTSDNFLVFSPLRCFCAYTLVLVLSVSVCPCCSVCLMSLLPRSDSVLFLTFISQSFLCSPQSFPSLSPLHLYIRDYTSTVFFLIPAVIWIKTHCLSYQDSLWKLVFHCCSVPPLYFHFEKVFSFPVFRVLQVELEVPCLDVLEHVALLCLVGEVFQVLRAPEVGGSAGLPPVLTPWAQAGAGVAGCLVDQIGFSASPLLLILGQTE